MASLPVHDMSKLLDGAFERVDRAGEHLADLNRRIAAFREEYQNAALDNLQPEYPEMPQFGGGDPVPPGLPKYFIGSLLPVPLRVGTLVGETCYNLRAALDYLVYELAYIDARGRQEGTQFPIVGKTLDPGGRRQGWLKEFAGLRSKYLNGINQAHVALIERYQPYNGCDWTETLRDISNPDKHKHLTFVFGDSTGYARVALDPATLRDEPGPIRSTKFSGGQEVYVQFVLHLEIAFNDGTRVPETLEKLKLDVAQTLVDFTPEFKRISWSNP